MCLRGIKIDMEFGGISREQRLRSCHGSVLIWAMVLSLCLVLLGTTYFLIADNFGQVYSCDHSRIANTYAKYSGLLVGKLAFRDFHPTAPTGTYWRNYYGNTDFGFGVAPNRNAIGGLKSWANSIVWGTSKTVLDNGNIIWEDSVSYARGLRQSFSDFLWLINDNHEIGGDSIIWWTPDTIDGKLYLNDYLYIHNTQNHPLFLKQVWTTERDTRPPHETFDWQDVFRGGLVLNAPRINFPDYADEVRSHAYGDYLIGRADSANQKMYYIRFFDGNSFKVLSSNRNSAFAFDTTCNTPGIGWNSVPTIPMPPNGAVFVYGKLYIDAPKSISGQANLEGIDGRLTIAASDTIIILHNIYYNCTSANGNVPYNCDDVLGLISEKYVLLSKNCGAPLYPGQGALIVNAALAALHGSFSCEDINNAPEFNELFLQGSITTNFRGILHRGAAGSGSGFVMKQIRYDQRLEGNPPPYFLTSDNIREIYVE
jgi:hypothetical protein